MMDPAEKKAMITNVTNGIINRLTEADRLQLQFTMDFQSFSVQVTKDNWRYYRMRTTGGEYHHSATIKGLRKHIRTQVDRVITIKERNNPCD